MQAALQSLLEESGLPATGARYVAQKGITNLCVLAALFATKEQLMERLAEPFGRPRSGWPGRTPS